jgi:hypothetical protein
VVDSCIRKMGLFPPPHFSTQTIADLSNAHWNLLMFKMAGRRRPPCSTVLILSGSATKILLCTSMPVLSSQVSSYNCFI